MRPVQPAGDLGMPADQGDAERGAGRAEVGKQTPHVGFFPLLRQECRRQQPARRRAQAGEVIGVDVDGVPADAVGGERDRVALGNEQPSVAGRTKHVYDRGIGPNPRADDDARIVLRQVCQQRGQECGRELAETHRHRSSRLPRPCRGSSPSMVPPLRQGDVDSRVRGNDRPEHVVPLTAARARTGHSPITPRPSFDTAGRLHGICCRRHHGAMPAKTAFGRWPRLGWRPVRETERRELLDEAPAGASLAGNLADLRRANHWFGGRALVRRYLQPRLRALPRHSRVTLLDIGTGGADLPAAFLAWAAENGQQGWAVGVDPSAGVIETTAALA